MYAVRVLTVHITRGISAGASDPNGLAVQASAVQRNCFRETICLCRPYKPGLTQVVRQTPSGLFRTLINRL